MNCCAIAVHESFKESGLRPFLAQTMLLGIQDFGENLPRLVLADCPRCHSTLGMEIGCCALPEDTRG